MFDENKKHFKASLKPCEQSHLNKKANEKNKFAKKENYEMEQRRNQIIIYSQLLHHLFRSLHS